MNLLYKNVHKSPSLIAFSDYREAEAQNDLQTSVSCSGELLEYETLELRVNPPNIDVDNNYDPSCTLITVDSANRPGTLVEVVQHFTELGLNVRRARISSDGGWFVDVFEVTDSDGSQVTSARKLASIKQMLNIHLRGQEVPACNADETDDTHRVVTTVLELAGQDQSGLLADVTHLLTTNGCDVRSAAVWTFKNRVAFVLSVTDRGEPVRDGIKLQRLQQLLCSMMDQQGNGIVNIKTVRGEVHHERRLHVLMLREEEMQWERGHSKPRYHMRWNPSLGDTAGSPTDSAGSMHAEYMNLPDADCDQLSDYRSPKHSRPDVSITHSSMNKYWLVTIKCRDRTKLLFDTVCTLADMDYDVFHATIDSIQGDAMQEYYIKPRLGKPELDESKAAKLAAMMESSILRRFPRGLKVHVHSVDRFGCLAALTSVLKQTDLAVTRAKVKTFAVNHSSGHTFYVMDSSGDAPDRDKVELACKQIGGHLVEAGEEARSASSGQHRFSFSFLNRQWQKNWNGEGSSPSSSHGSV
ncbi:hypothetical protein ABBQ38_003051 [Trebouxia sp. C0009 RCD-2024]